MGLYEDSSQHVLYCIGLTDSWIWGVVIGQMVIGKSAKNSCKSFSGHFLCLFRI